LTVPLSPLAVQVFKELRQITGKRRIPFWGCVGDRIYSGMPELTGFDDVTFHDLRRTCSTGLQRLGFKPHILSVVLGHATEEGAVDSDVHYLHSRRESEHRVALERWAAHIEGLLERAAGGQTHVLPFRA
jgi:integrase